MMRLVTLVSTLLMLAAPVLGTTGHDLRARIVIDGIITDWEVDEWVLDPTTAFPERPGDSRWGDDNDIARIGVTWDDYNLYIAVPAVTVSTTLLVLLDTMCGGVDDLTVQDYFRRNIEFAGISPNVMIRASRTTSETIAGYLDCTRPFNLIDNDAYGSAYLQDYVRDGALELSLPWEIIGGFERTDDGVVLPADDIVLKILAAVTGGPGTGAGDAAPDPSVAVEDDSTRIALLDNHIEIALDADGDGLVDAGVSPRDAARYAIAPSPVGDPIRRVLPIKVRLVQKLFTPDRDGRFECHVTLDPPDYEYPVYVTASIYSAAGRRVRTLLDEEPLVLSGEPVTIGWDGKDDQGGDAPAGVYVIAVSGGAGRGTAKNTAKASFAVAR